ncbi:bifunctional sulfate adenylyltransferase/adenylylsulfate kinase [Luteibacter sp. 9133]|uniref:bifunctional sulfate adenylyltransferase/adenylylsulfate kinase n=1 Tax=Luteibacter sp. 9133 TaxID=1500891 RepID=UPI000AA2DD6A|nr:bifunctional sulfate adenylyltransferase/adenylylsulfate kinase [Luteibacter sp. 9133]
MQESFPILPNRCHAIHGADCIMGFGQAANFLQAVSTDNSLIAKGCLGQLGQLGKSTVQSDESARIIHVATLFQMGDAHGGILQDLRVTPGQASELRRASGDLPSVVLDERQLCDLEMLMHGAFSPLRGFLSRDDYESVVERMRLANGTLWPIPITLDVPVALSGGIGPGSKVALRDAQGVLRAVLSVTDAWIPDREREASKVFGTTDSLHPGARYTLGCAGSLALGGPVSAVCDVDHHDFTELRDTPATLRAWFSAKGWDRIVAFQTRNPMHRAHRELTLRAAEKVGGKLLIHPVVGQSKPGDVDHYTRVRCYRALLPYYPADSVKLSLLPLAMRMAGPREAIWHAIIRKNYGATHFIVGRDHAGPGNDRDGRPFYDPFAAQRLLKIHEAELGIVSVLFPAMVYAVNRDAYLPSDEVLDADEVKDVSGTQLRQHLRDGTEIPPWFSFPEVVRILRERHPMKKARGFAVFFTGLSGAGKSTIAQALMARLMEGSARPVTLLDGDEVRRHISRGLGFSREDRAANVERIGYIAGEVVRHGGIAICAPIAPFADSRADARKWVEAHGAFVEVYVCTDIEVCESRDIKGLYAQARAGRLANFTGVNDPYEAPEYPELRLDGNAGTPRELAGRVVELLVNMELLETAETVSWRGGRAS